MILYAGKLLSRLLMPLPAALALIAFALLLAARGRRGAALVCGSLPLAGLWLAATPAVADRFLAGLERVHEAPPLAALAPADAILVLGGAIKPALPPREFPELSEPGDRVVYAARLFRAGRAPLVLVSGGKLPWQPHPPEAAALAEMLELLGVPAEAIVREEQSSDTHDNCVFAKRLLDQRGARDVLLVTSALHMRRALATCRSAGIHVRPAPTDFFVAGAGPTSVLDFIPDAETLMYTQLALRELVGFDVYRLRGWIHD